MNAAVTSPRRSIGASSLMSAWAPRKARPWPAPPSRRWRRGPRSECSGKASTSAASPATTSARPSGCDAGGAVAARGEQLRGARGGQQRARRSRRAGRGCRCRAASRRSWARPTGTAPRPSTPWSRSGSRARSRPGSQAAPRGAGCASARRPARARGSSGRRPRPAPARGRARRGSRARAASGAHCASAPASSGPALLPAPWTSTAYSAARPRSPCGSSSTSPAVAAPVTIPTDSPWTARAANSHAVSFAAANSAEADGGRQQARGDHALAPDAVRQLPAQQQRRHEDDHVGREDEREHGAREAEALAVDRVQRRRQVAAEQQREERDASGSGTGRPARSGT